MNAVAGKAANVPSNAMPTAVDLAVQTRADMADLNLKASEWKQKGNKDTAVMPFEKLSPHTIKKSTARTMLKFKSRSEIQLIFTWT